MNTYTFLASNKIKEEGDSISFFQAVNVTVYAENEDEALAKAKERLTRKEWLLTAISEHEDHFNEEIALTQLKIQKEMLDWAKGGK